MISNKNGAVHKVHGPRRNAVGALKKGFVLEAIRRLPCGAYVIGSLPDWRPRSKRSLKHGFIILRRRIARVGKVAVIGQRSRDHPVEQVRRDAQLRKAGGKPDGAGHLFDRRTKICLGGKAHGTGQTGILVLFHRCPGVAVEGQDRRHENGVQRAVMQLWVDAPSAWLRLCTQPRPF